MWYTPLFDEHTRRGGNIVDFHGWALPLQFAGILVEHHHTRTAVSVFDCSHMGEFLICGQDGIRAFDGLVCCDIWGLPAGRGRYGAMLNDTGGIIDDIIAFRLSADELYVVTNAGPLETVSARILAAVPDAANVSDATAKIDVQGPRSREVMIALGFHEAAALRYYGVCRTQWRGTPLVLTRAGYTGELGFEVYIPNSMSESLWQALLEIERVAPAGLGARDTLRMEMCYPLSGQDSSESRTPLELGMDRFIAKGKRFVGERTLLAQRETDYALLTPVRTPDRRALRSGFGVYDGNGDVGVITSGTFGPSVGYGIGLAFLPRASTLPGTRFTAGPRRVPIETVDSPFYRLGTCRQ